MEITHPHGPVVLFGASYLESWKVDRLGDVPVINRAQHGLATGELIDAFASVVPPDRPRAVVLWGFTDLVRASSETLERVLAQECENIRALVGLAVENGIEPVLTTELTRRSPETWLERGRALVTGLAGSRLYQQYVNDCVVQLNAFIRRLAAREELLLIDAQAMFSRLESTKQRGFIRCDGRQITAAGYAAMTAYSAPVLGFLFGEDEPADAHVETRRRRPRWTPPGTQLANARRRA